MLHINGFLPQNNELGGVLSNQLLLLTPGFGFATMIRPWNGTGLLCTGTENIKQHKPLNTRFTLWDKLELNYVELIIHTTG